MSRGFQDRIRRALAAAVVGVAGALGACSAGAQPYVFASVLSDTEFKGPTIDSTSSVLFIGAGYRLSRFFAGELAYFNPGKFDQSTSVTQGGNTFGSLRSWKTAGPGLAGVASLPAGSYFSLFLRGGAYWMETETFTQETRFTPPDTLVVTRKETARQRRVAPSIGIGAEFTVSKFHLRALLEQIDGRGDVDSIRTATVQVGVSF